MPDGPSPVDGSSSSRDYLPNIADHEPEVDRPVLVLVAGSVAAAAGGLFWALIVVLTQYEVGWVAWGIGFLVGFTMAVTTSVRSPALGIRAALLAGAGLVFGKLLIVEFAVVPNLAQEIRADSTAMKTAVFMAMVSDSTLLNDLQGELDLVPRGDTLSDDLAERLDRAVSDHVVGMGEAAADSVAKRYAKFIVSDAGILRRLRSQLSPLDLLWFFLAIATAWRLTAAPVKREPATEPEPPDESESKDESS